MGAVTATLVVDLKDKTGNSVQTVIGNLDRMKRAERELALAGRGAKLSRRDRAMENMMIERERSQQERRQTMATWAARGTVAAAAVGIAAGKAYADFADTERRVNRILINADRGAGELKPTVKQLQKVALDTRMSFDDVAGGVETLVASGRTLDESLSFLPSVALTAQASGSAMSDIALSADALSSSLKINAGEMQNAFDILVAGGKAGKFELRDMSQYLPSLLPAFSALGYTGTEGLQRIVAMLQIVRNQAGSSGEAATYMGNILNKIYSEETAKKFKKVGIDLPKTLDKAKASGKDVVGVLLDATRVATKGDLSKLSLLFQDAEVQKGIRALMTQRQETEALSQSLSNVDGTALKDFGQIAEDSASKIQRLSTLWDKFKTQVGGGVATVANPVLDFATNAIDDTSAAALATAGMDEEQRNWQQKDFKERYRKLHPDAWFWDVNDAYFQAKVRVGRQQQKSVMDGLDIEEGRITGGEQTARYPSRGSYDPALVDGERDRPVHRHGSIPIPMPRTDEAASDPPAIYPSRGTYDPDQVMIEQELERRRERMKRAAVTPTAPADLGSGFSWRNFLFGKAADPDFNVKDQMGINLRPDQPSAAAPQAVTFQGPIVTQPSGVQQVQITNAPPRPNINITMNATINEAQDPTAIVNQIGQRLRDEMEGMHASTNDSGL